MEEREPLIVGKHYPAIDGLRGFAVLLVMWFHSSYLFTIGTDSTYSYSTKIYYVFSIMGETGVDLFFVLSGFLITGILIDTCRNKNNLKNFYIRRLLRIFPLYYSVLLIFIVYFLFVFGVDDTQGGLDHGKIMLHLFYLQNWLFNNNTDQFILMDHTWSLAVEEQFYLLWPLFFLSVYKSDKPYKAIALCLILIAISWALRIFFGAHDLYKWAYTFTFSRMDELSLGALLSILCIHKSKWLMRIHKFLPYIIVICLVIVVTILFVGVWQSGGDVQGAHDVSVVYGLIIFSVLYFSLLAYVFLSPDTNILNRALSIKPMRRLGKVSYGLYLFHGPVMVLVARWIYNTDMSYWLAHPVLLFVGGGISFALAFLSYHFYEKLFLRLKDKWAPLKDK